MVAVSILHRRSPAAVGGGERRALGRGRGPGVAGPAPVARDTRVGGGEWRGVEAAVPASPPGRSALRCGGALARRGPRMQICV